LDVTLLAQEVGATSVLSP